MKRFLSLTTLLLFAVTSFAHDFEVDGIYYEITSSSSNPPTVRVSCKGGYYKTYDNEYTGNVTIPETVTYNGKIYSVTSIGEAAFRDCSSLTSICIPNSVTYIGYKAFGGCYSFTKVIITDIEKWCSVSFGGNDSNPLCYAHHLYSEENQEIKDLVIPDGVTIIKDFAFDGCSGFTSVTIPKSVTTIGSWAFHCCSGLTSITIPEGVTSIGDYAFYNCSGLMSINIPESVTTIGDDAFSGCKGLTSITIPSSVTSIGSWAFYECNKLTSITIPNSVTSIGIDAFYNTPWYNNQPDGLVYAGKVAYKYKETMPSNTSIVLEEGTSGIAGSAFRGCSGLKSITIPSSVTTIGPGAFYGCTGLTSITIPSSVTKIGSSAFYGTAWYDNQPDGMVYAGKVAYSYKGTMPANIVLEEGTSGIADYAFRDCSGFTSITIPEGVTSIGSFAFSGCTGLTNITIPSSVTSIGKYAFYECNPDLKFYVDENTISLFRLWYGGINNSGVFNRTYDVNTGEKIELFKTTASSVRVVSPEPKNYTITSQSLTIDGKSVESPYYAGGLSPNTNSNVSLTIKYKDAEGSENTFYTSQTVKTQELTLTTEQPKVVSMGNVVVSATTNVDADEKNVGFEWRRTDWTSDFASNSGSAVVYDNTMEGYIRNMNTDKLWKYRAYYLSDDGTYYYGDWVGLDPSNTSYFEPTVHTYADISTTGKVALIRGYVLNGTDKVTVQGFKYWKTANKSNSLDIAMEAKPQAAVVSVPADAITETVAIVGAGQQLMNATLENLDYGSTYQCVAFATTSENETFYGEVQTFTTEAAPTGIEGVKENARSSKPVTVVACYDINGKRLSQPQKGLNILKMSDGTTRKVVR